MNPPTSNLCQACRGISVESLRSSGGYQHLSPISMIRSSCQLCTVLRKSIWTHFDREDTPLYLSIAEKHSTMGHLEAHLTFSLKLANTDEKQEIIALTYITTTLRDPAATGFGVPTFREVSYTGSSGTLDVAKAWLEQCTLKHDCYTSLFEPLRSHSKAPRTLQSVKVSPTYSPTTTAPLAAEIPPTRKGLQRLKATSDSSKDMLVDCDEKADDVEDTDDGRDLQVPFHLIDGCTPTRLLDTGAFAADSSDIRLIKSESRYLRYAALSYCWGTSSNGMFRTTTENFSKRLARISFQELPRTFQDAVTTCRHLSIRYLWIDSLCIIQDSLEDWKQESANMANVYSNCILTIAADGSSNSHDGCFYSHPSPIGLDTNQAVCVKGVLSDGRASSIWFHSMHYKPNLVSLQREPLAKRAWAYQERALSPRIFHFTQRQLFWECRREFCGEDLVPRDHGSVQPMLILQMRSQPNVVSKIHVWCTWVLRHYTSASLSVPADRLPAISAIARLFYEEIKSPYIAGLWEEGLWYTLCWYRLNPEEFASREGPYIAPSWSWASVNAPVWWLIQMPDDETVQLVTIEEAVVDSGRDPFGRVSSGSIRLTGRALLDQPLDKRRSGFEWLLYLDYPGEPPSHVDYILMAKDNKFHTKLFLLVARSPNNDKLYERHGVAQLDESGSISDPETSSWPVKIFTII